MQSFFYHAKSRLSEILLESVLVSHTSSSSYFAFSTFQHTVDDVLLCRMLPRVDFRKSFLEGSWLLTLHQGSQFDFSTILAYYLMKYSFSRNSICSLRRESHIQPVAEIRRLKSDENKLKNQGSQFDFSTIFAYCLMMYSFGRNSFLASESQGPSQLQCPRKVTPGGKMK